MRAVCLLVAVLPAAALSSEGSGREHFEQLDPILPTPTEVRLASGAPGPAYWQQRADYEIEVTLDDAKQRITGKARITYTNNSPHSLDYLWMQLDQNRFRRDSSGITTATAPAFGKFPYGTLRYLVGIETFEGGFQIDHVRTKGGKGIEHTVVDTMMRLDLSEPLEPGDDFVFDIAWAYNINDNEVVWGRGGYEYFEKDDNRIYTIAQWYPRMAAYTDYAGWQNKQFMGRGEFTLELGDYEVAITVPEDMVVGATGELQNAKHVLTRTQRRRWEEARKALKTPVLLVTRDEATANEKSRATTTRTWRFEAKNVRDFAWAASRKFLWDAMAVQIGKRRVMAMSYYPKEAEPLWRRYSTHSVAHALEIYSEHTFDYPYPVCISVNGPVGGMEYPMISFNGPRAEEDGTYYARAGEGKRWNRSKYGLISVVIHEVGHNWFPMIVNSDERQWTWMDEGLNTFLQFIAEQAWEEDYPSWRGQPRKIVEYMRSSNQVPIMTNSESILQFGNNAYAKPATALNILRETIMGRELFDHAFKTYARRWRFKHPEPADLFRTMEDASGVDLDWFWRGWFYGTGRVDLGITAVRQYTMDTADPDKDKPAKKKEEDEEPDDLFDVRNTEQKLPRRINRFPDLKDFYNDHDPDAVTAKDREDFEKMLKDLEPWEREMLKVERNFYVVDLENVGTIPMPVLLDIVYEDGSKESLRIPAEIWRRNARQVSRLLMTKKVLKSIELDHHQETADVDLSNNHWPRKPIKSRFQLFRETRKDNAMQMEKKATEKAEKDAEEAAEKKAKEAAEKKKPEQKDPK